MLGRTSIGFAGTLAALVGIPVGAFLLSLSSMQLPAHAHGGHDASGHGSSGHGHAPEHVWRLVGGTEIHGSFVRADHRIVQLRQSNDSVVEILRSELTADDERWVSQKLAKIRAAQLIMAAGGVSAMMASTAMVEAATAPEPPSEMLNAFEPFVKRNEIKTRWDDRFFYVE
ncbi:MAG: hypothetical protein FJ308_16795, partial [Planctomycetes bacterium]|nr:hypothetical protein [Planctomycetota bacterium]